MAYLAKLESRCSHAISTAAVSYFTAASFPPPVSAVHSFPPPHSPAPCFADLSVLAQWRYTTAHSCTMREREIENKTGFTHERGQWSFFLAAMIKQKTLFKGIILLHQLNIKLVASASKDMEPSPLFSGASFPIKLRDADEKILCIYTADKKKFWHRGNKT